MFKTMLSVLFLGMGLSCFSEECVHGLQSTEVNLDEEKQVLFYIGCGNNHLLSNDFSYALEDFQMASNVLSQRENRSPEQEFVIAFGKIIAYDNLGSYEQTQNALVSLFTLIFNGDEEEDDELESDESPQEYDEKGEAILKQLAGLARSPNIRELLNTLMAD